MSTVPLYCCSSLLLIPFTYVALDYVWTFPLLYGSPRKPAWSLLSLAAGLITQLSREITSASSSLSQFLIVKPPLHPRHLGPVDLLRRQFFPLGCVAVSGDIIDCHTLRWVWPPCSCLIGRGQGCCWTTYEAQGSPPPQIIIWSKMSLVLRLRNLALGLSHHIS